MIDALIANSCAVFLRKYGLLLAALILVSALGALAQTNSGQIRGSVTDPTGAVIPNASVSITTADGHTVATATSNSAGAYQAGHLAAGTYIVIGNAQGFATSASKAVTVGAGESKTFNVTLPVAEVKQQVQVDS